MMEKRHFKKSKRKIDSLGAHQIVEHKYPAFIEWFAGVSVMVSENAWVKWISVGILGMTILANYPIFGDDYDLWFHLSYGKHFVSNLTWHIDPTQFSWTQTDVSNWIYCTWIGSSLMYIIYQCAGIVGLNMLQWTILLINLLLMMLYTRLLGDKLDIFRVLCLMLVALTLKLTQVYIKPQLFSTLLFTLVVFLYFYSSQLPNQKIKTYYIYPLIFLLWVNIHGEFFVGLIFVSVALLGEIVSSIIYKRFKNNKHTLVTFGGCVIVSFLVILLNPDGINYPLSIFKGLLTKPDIDNSMNVSMLGMWSYVGFSNISYNFVFAADTILLMGIIYLFLFIVALKKNIRANIPILILNMAFFVISMTAARSTLFYPIVWIFSIYTLISQAELWKLKRNLCPYALLLFLFIASFSIYLTLVSFPYATWFGYKFDQNVPTKEVEFIKENHLPGPIFNDYLLGAYMMWSMYPEYKVWIDPRWAPYTKQVLPDWLNIVSPSQQTLENFNKFTDKYPFKVALIGMNYSPVIFWFLHSPDWRLLYFDKVAAVLVHKSIIPQLSPEALATEVGTIRFSSINNPVILYNLFQFYIQVGASYANDIRSFYERNVSDWYQSKKQQLAIMSSFISQKENEIKQKSQNAPNQL